MAGETTCSSCAAANERAAMAEKVRDTALRLERVFRPAYERELARSTRDLTLMRAELEALHADGRTPTREERDALVAKYRHLFPESVSAEEKP